MKNEAIAVDASPARFRRGSARAFSRVLVEYGELGADPAQVFDDHEVARLLDRIPATTPLELRDRAMFEVAYGCGLRAEELVNLDMDSLDADSEEVRVEGKGGRTRVVHHQERGVLGECERPGDIGGELSSRAPHLGGPKRRL